MDIILEPLLLTMNRFLQSVLSNRVNVFKDNNKDTRMPSVI